jgi:hypothetical protein
LNNYVTDDFLNPRLPNNRVKYFFPAKPSFVSFTSQPQTFSLLKLHHRPHTSEIPLSKFTIK